MSLPKVNVSNAKKYGFSLSNIITWGIQIVILTLITYGFYFKVDSHLKDKVKHTSSAERVELGVRLEDIRGQLKGRDSRVKEIVRQTIRQLKQEGYLK